MLFDLSEIFDIKNVEEIINKILIKLPRSQKELALRAGKIFNISDLDQFNGAIIFGAAKMGPKIAKIFKSKEIKLQGFSDNNASLWQTKIEGLRVIPPDDLDKYQDRKIVIASKYVADVNNQLNKLGILQIIPHYVLTTIFPELFTNPLWQGTIVKSDIEQQEIIRAYSMLSDIKSENLFKQIVNSWCTLQPNNLPRKSEEEQYFPNEFWKLNANESFVDVGAYNGDTLKVFLEKTKGNFAQYIALEPDKKNFQALNKSIPQKLKNKIKVICAGAGDKNQELSFSGMGGEDAKIQEQGKYKVRVNKLDDILSGTDVTTVKMDVEGFEPKVIQGMKSLIKRKHPKLAVCIYHHPNQLWKIPLLITKLNPDYKSFYLRHHDEDLYETVLYAF